MNFVITKNNYDSLLRVALLAKQNKTKKIEISITGQANELPPFSNIMPLLYEILKFESYFEVWLKNFPFCVVTHMAISYILPEKNRGEKTAKCKSCAWNKRCAGFSRGYFKKFGTGEICPEPDLPKEVMIEIESRCNFSCPFCFNKISFAGNGRNVKEISATSIKKIIDSIASAGIKVVRFTGGEPLLRQDIFQLAKYAKQKNLEVRLNTNGSLVDKEIARKIKIFFDNVLIPVESYSCQKEEISTGFQHSLKKKIKAVKLLKKAGVKIVRIGTVATKDNIINFDKIAKLVMNLPIDDWELYRPVSVTNSQELTPVLINILVDKLIALRRNTGKTVFIANALPFCAVKDLNKISCVSKGALFEDGHNRIVVDPRGFAKPHYFIDENIGNPRDILSCWDHPFMKKLRNLKFLPKQCDRCDFAFKCRGGSRWAAKLAHGDYGKLDPLANTRNAYRRK